MNVTLGNVSRVPQSGLAGKSLMIGSIRDLGPTITDVPVSTTPFKFSIF